MVLDGSYHQALMRICPLSSIIPGGLCPGGETMFITSHIIQISELVDRLRHHRLSRRPGHHAHQTVRPNSNGSTCASSVADLKLPKDDVVKNTKMHQEPCNGVFLQAAAGCGSLPPGKRHRV